MRFSFQHVSILVLLATMPFLGTDSPTLALDWDTEHAWTHLENYMDLSPILPDSPANLQFRSYVTRHLEENLWDVEIQSWLQPGTNYTLHNLIAKKSMSKSSVREVVVLGAHYDNRIFADKDPNPSNRYLPVPGANDGGSGVVILLELARVLDIPQKIEIWLVFFDAEDQGGIPGWVGGIAGWCIGSTYFVEQLSPVEREKIRVAIIVDLVGDFNLILKKEGYSDPAYVQEIWEVATELGYTDCFVDYLGGGIIDDHQPFLKAGIPAVDIIQQASIEGYPFFRWHHTTNDTIENVSPKSLEKVGRTLEYYLEHNLVEVASVTSSITTSEPVVTASDFPNGSILFVAISTLIIFGLIRRKSKTSLLKVN